MPTAYLAESSRILSEAALLLQDEDASYYRSLSITVKEAWEKSFVHENGKMVTEDKQDHYLRAVHLDQIHKNTQKNSSGPIGVVD